MNWASLSRSSAPMPMASAPVASAPAPRVGQVIIDGLVVLKIIKHSQESYESVAGGLLGLNRGDKLEITYRFQGDGFIYALLDALSFPYLAADKGGDEEYEDDMLKALNEVNIDTLNVGWYQSSYLGSYFTKDTISHQLDFQQTIENSVVIIYDGVKTSQGTLSLKALRLTDTFCDAWKDKKISNEHLAHLPSSSIFEEIPIKIRNPHLIQAFMLDLVTRHTITTSIRGASTANATAAIDRAGLPGTLGVADEGDTEFSRLDLNAAPFLEKHMEALSDVTNSLLRASVEAFSSRQRKQRDEQRRREAEARRANDPTAVVEEEPPSRPDPRAKDPLDVMLMSAQISNYCSQVAKFSGASFGKLFLAGSLGK